MTLGRKTRSCKTRICMDFTADAQKKGITVKAQDIAFRARIRMFLGFSKIIRKTLTSIIRKHDNSIFSSPVGSLCHTPGVVRRPSSVVRRLCHLQQLKYGGYERNIRHTKIRVQCVYFIIKLLKYESKTARSSPLIMASVCVIFNFQLAVKL